jgi:hypothetical protein
MHRHRRSFSTAFCAALLAIAVTASSTLGLTWGAITTLSDVATANAWAYGMVASGSRIFTAYRELDADGRHIAFRASIDGGATFTASVEISRPEATDSYQSALAYSGGVLHAVWLEGDVSLTSSVELYSRSTDDGATWSVPVAVTPDTVTSASSSRVFASGSRVFLAYTDGVTGQVYLIRSTDAGLTFGARRQIATTSYEGFSTGTDFDGKVSMAFGTGVTYVAFRTAARVIRVRRSTDGGTTWKAAVTIDSRTGSDPIVTAAGASAIISYSYYDSTHREYAAIRRTTTKGVAWLARQKLSIGTTAYSNDTWVLRANSRWHVVYTRCVSPCDVVALWYRSSTNGITWSTPQRFAPPNAGVWPVGFAATSVPKRVWVAWDSMDASGDSDFTVMLRPGG